MNDDMILKKYNGLLDYLKELGSVTIAFSGGVDSAFLLMAAREALGAGATAVTMATAAFTQEELDAAKQLCEDMDVRYWIETADVFDIEGFAANPPDRCYICKKYLLRRVIEAAQDMECVHVAEGSNIDDMSDYRPGMKAVKELGILSPLIDSGFSKQEIRRMSELRLLPTWNKPSYACLASRFVYGERITTERLKMVGQAEKYLHGLGFPEVRVRVHGESNCIARIEVPDSMISRVCDDNVRQAIAHEMSQLGFAYAALDMTGYRTGSMNLNMDGAT